MRYVHIPVADIRDLNAQNAQLLMKAIDEPGARPAIVYCASGNRVGALFALKAFYVDGETVDEAFVTGERAGLTRLAGAVRQHLETATDG